MAANLLLLLGPPLISQDVFGYLEFARLGVLHGLDPYTHVAAEAPTDAVFPFIGWPFQHSPYGPLFTLGTYPLASLGLGGGLWALKLLAVASSLAAVALTASAARMMGRSAKVAAVFVGLNPVLLGACRGRRAQRHARAARAGRGAGARGSKNRHAPRARGGHRRFDEPRRPPGDSRPACRRDRREGLRWARAPVRGACPRAWRERARVAASALGALVLLAVIAVVGFGTHAFGFLGALGEQQQLIATHSLPAETARWVGLSGLPAWWRDLFVAGFLVVLVLTLWRTARGGEWRAMAGWATLALLLSTAWLLPWYAIWVLPLAALADSRRLRVATLLFCAYAILIHLPLADPLLSPTHHVSHTAGRRCTGGSPRAGWSAAMVDGRRIRRSPGDAPRCVRSPRVRPRGAVDVVAARPVDGT